MVLTLLSLKGTGDCPEDTVISEILPYLSAIRSTLPGSHLTAIRHGQSARDGCNVPTPKRVISCRGS
ncbi:tRNA dimethylallyltransferase [Fusarium oxysporum f. sp. albedinis]|nr:tRNA dimethylallyltransferase [Fusarium oxysporum f. sp. albedinis]